jgi:acyl-CoA hydrolase
LRILERHGDLIQRIGGTSPFEQGLYGASEMFVNGFLFLYQEGILKRRVYDSVPLQRLLNEGRSAKRSTSGPCGFCWSGACFQPI